MNFKDFLDDFKAMCLSHKDVRAVYYGGADRIIERMNNKILYPCVWIEEPEFSYSDNGGIKNNYTFNILVLDKPANQLNDTEDAVKWQCKEILDAIIGRLYYNIEAGYSVELKVNDIAGQFKGLFGGDADVGVDIQITLTLPAELCFEESDWDI